MGRDDVVAGTKRQPNLAVLGNTSQTFFAMIYSSLLTTVIPKL